MGLFDDAGIDAEDLDTGLKDGPHDAILTEVDGYYVAQKVDDKIGREHVYVVFEYTTPDHGFPVKDFFEILPKGMKITDCDDTDDSYNKYTGRGGVEVRQTEKKYYLRKFRELKANLIALGVPETQVNNVDPKDLKGTAVVIVTKKKGKSGFAQIESVSVPGSSGTSLPKPTSFVSAQPTVASAPTVATAAPAAAVGANPFAR